MRSLVRPMWLMLAALVVAPALTAQDEPALGNPYYPLQVGNKWTYKAGGQKVVIEVMKKESLTRPNDKMKKYPGFTLKITSGDKSMTEQVAILNDGVKRFQAAGKVIEPPLLFFKLPLNKGEDWKVESTSDGTLLKGTFRAGEDTVKVPAGSFQAMTVSSTDFQIGGQTMELQYWFAPQVGLVKQTVKTGSLDTTLELLSFEQGK